MKRVIGCAIALVVAGYVGILVHYHWFTPEGKMMWTPQGRDAWKKILAKHPDAVVKDWVGPVKSARMDAECVGLLTEEKDAADIKLGIYVKTILDKEEFIKTARTESIRESEKASLLKAEQVARECKHAIDEADELLATVRGGASYAYIEYRTRGKNVVRVVVMHKGGSWMWSGDSRDRFVGYFKR